MAKTVIDFDKLRGIKRDKPQSIPATAAPEQKQRTLSLKRFSEKVRDKVAPAAKKIVAVAALTAATLSPTGKVAPSQNTSANTKTEIELAEQRREIVLSHIAQTRSSELSAEIVNDVAKLQAQIKEAKDNSQRNPAVERILDEVYTYGGLSGNNNYCVAGAIYAHLQCDDPIMRKILPDPEKRPEDFTQESNSKYWSHPNVSCPALQQYFRDNYGENYAGPKDPNFKEVLQNLQAGDILTLYQASNSSSGHHCVTCIGPVENGIVQVKSLNGEGTYPVAVSRISGAACVMKQYRETYMREMAQEMPADRFIPLSISEKLQMNAQMKAPSVSAPLLAEQTSNKGALSYAQLYNKYTQSGRM